MILVTEKCKPLMVSRTVLFYEQIFVGLTHDIVWRRKMVLVFRGPRHLSANGCL